MAFSFHQASWPNKLRHVSPSSPHFLALISPQNRLARFSVRVTSASSAKKTVGFLAPSLSPPPPIVYTVVSSQWSQFGHWPFFASFIIVGALSISLFSAPLELRLLKPQKMMNNSSPLLIFMSPFCSASIRLCSPSISCTEPIPSHKSQPPFLPLLIITPSFNSTWISTPTGEGDFGARFAQEVNRANNNRASEAANNDQAVL